MLSCAHSGQKIANSKEALIIHHVKRGTKVVIAKKALQPHLSFLAPVDHLVREDGNHSRVNIYGVSLDSSGVVQEGDFRVSVDLGAIGLYFPRVFKTLCYGKPE